MGRETVAWGEERELGTETADGGWGGWGVGGRRKGREREGGGGGEDETLNQECLSW